MNNSQFLQVLKESFITYLKTSPRSNKKLLILHGAISKDFAERLGKGYEVSSLGYKAGKEKVVAGRYIDKAVDITVLRDGKPVAGIAVKYVMSNYAQNSNNYFENMLGETANIRTANIPYFQVFVIPDKIPYFNKQNDIQKWEQITGHNLEKYIRLSQDNIDTFMHTPNKTLFFLVHIPESEKALTNKKDYNEYYLSDDFQLQKSNMKANFGNAVVYNDYETFAEKVTYAIKSI